MEYQPLQGAQSHIRLLTIHPRSLTQNQNLSDLVHCTLETVSLEDIRDAYNEFIAKLDSEHQFHRATQAQWSEATSEDEAPSKKIELSPRISAYRFK